MGKRKAAARALWDRFPQFISGSVSQSAADATETTTITLPRDKYGPSTPIIIEVLKIMLWFRAAAPTSFPDASSEIIRIAFGTKNNGSTLAQISDPHTLAAYTLGPPATFGTAASAYWLEGPITLDLTDGMGHGQLVATDNLYCQVSGNNDTAGFSFDYKILYRFVNVALTEYIGILQSQQYS